MINAVAPTRICDVGGWTDTHFAGHGSVFNIAVYPYVEVQVAPVAFDDPARRIIISAENYGTAYSLDPREDSFERHPLIEAAIRRIKIRDDMGVKINIFSYAPPGASTGTSAAVSVAIIGALKHLAGEKCPAHDIAALAHSVECEDLHLECGIQDQLASAYGGVNFIEITRFPESKVTPVHVRDQVWWELEQRLLLVYIGKPHKSSEIHRAVIRELGQNAGSDDRMVRLRQLACEAKEHFEGGDFKGLGRVFNENTEVQRRLHSSLVCDSFEDIISTAAEFGAAGCKVNGAGGDGGSVSILTDGDMQKKRRLQGLLEGKGYSSVPVYLSRRGLRVWER